MNNVASAVSRILNQHATSSGKGKLLWASCMATSASLLLCASSPALADGCTTAQNSNCTLGQTPGSPGSSAPGPGENGGDGGPGPFWNFSLDGVHYVDDPTRLLSPINITSYGGDGADAKDGGLTGGGKATGGNGGTGGAGGDLSVIVGPNMSGTTSSVASGITLATVGGTGGEGTFGAVNHTPGVGGVGGTGGHITANLSGNFPDNLTNRSRGIDMWSQGGNGGNGDNWTFLQDPQAPGGGAGGNGGQIDVTLNGTFVGDAGGVRVSTYGGTGGTGGEAESVDGAQDGDGGAGGAAGAVNVTVGASARIEGFANQDGGLIARSIGGTGGKGGSGGGSGGNAGAGGDGGDVNVTINGGNVRNGAGTQSAGILAQSLGGAGGDGGAASVFVIGPNGGSGSVGGSAGQVSITTGSQGSSVTVISGQSGAYEDDYSLSPGVLAQSIGGGGGGGANSKGWFAVGGNGGNAVDGNFATVDLLANITTYGINSDGIAVQSIGGGGGKGGDAQGSGVGVNMVIGGDGGGGGDGATVYASSRAGSVIETNGAHSNGIVVQSVGGGGGMGGAAYSKAVSAAFGSSMSLGGDGGVGGDGGNVSLVGTEPTNAGRITTIGSDSYGILAQSIGGGGGVGGASTAMAKVYGGDDVPSISLTMAMGGSGGAGGTAHAVQVENTGLITTSGAGSAGIVGQAIGGGGGAGGDASSASTSSKGDYGFAASFAFGGAGGNAGNGGNTSIANSGFIVTTGESGDGILAQSIGGGGGAGGSGDAKASSSSGKSLSLVAAIGGTATGGGDGGIAQVTNSGSILTLGDGAFGAAAQSIGGGGGRGGGAAGSTSGTYKVDLTIGAQGGSGGSSHQTDGQGNDVAMASITNSAGATIVTFGADANGIIAQSIAGGGGAGGKAGTNLGTSKSTGDGGNGDATGTSNTLASLASTFDTKGVPGLSQYAGLNNAIVVTNSLLNPPSSNVLAVADEDPGELLDETAQSKGETEDDNESTSIQIGVGVGGKGGSGGTAGKVDVENYGEVATMGSHSDAILAQSIGGGGGKGGGASTATSADYSGSVAVGGTGGDGGYGGTVIVNNYSNIYTKGSLAAGIVAQSISGGGGIGGASASSIKSGSNKGDDDGAFQSISVAVGGDGGAGLSSGQARVNNSGPISTAAHDAIGIIAQSISGGGGIVKTLATDQEAAGGSASAKDTSYDIQFKFGGSSGEASDAVSGGSGQVIVATTSTGSISTTGDNSYGILAQSIAGGGGLSLGGKPTGSTVGDFFGSGTKTGSVINDQVNDPTDPKSNSGLFVSVGGKINTAGQGAVGVLAQSIGGGGGLAGDTGSSSYLVGFTGGKSSNFAGSGGYVNVSVADGATVTTTGANAPAMFLQSIGGGGGRVTTNDAAYIGTAGGTGTGGRIDVTVNGTVQALGQNSGGIFAQSQGDQTSNSPITVTVGSTGVVRAGQNSLPTAGYGLSSGIYVSHGGMDAQHPNVVTNNGQIYTYGSGTNSVAVYSSAGYTEVYNNAGATMWGDVYLTNDGGTGCFTNNGTLNAGNQVTVGNCPVVNAGTINVGSASAAATGKALDTGAVGKLTISGDYVQTASGKLNIGADLKNGQADTVAVSGKATIAGTVNVNAMSVSNKPVTVLTAAGGVSVDPQLKQTDNSALFDFPVVASGNELAIQPTAHFNDAAANLRGSQKAVAGYLQTLFDGGASMDVGLDSLSKLSGGEDYAASLRSISGEGLGAFGAFRVDSSRAFANNLYQGCRELTFDRHTGDSCSWARVSGASSDQNARTDTVGYHADEYTLEVGGQVGLSDHLALVGSVGSEKSQFRGDDRASQIQGDAALGGVGLNFTNGPLELSGAIDGAYGWYRSHRTITVGSDSDIASAKPRQWQVGAHVRGAYEIPFATYSYFKPFVEGHAIRVSNDSFTEDGTSPFRLTVDGRSDTTFLAATGVELGAYIPTRFGAEVHPFVSAAAEFGQDVQWTTTAHFADQPTGAGFDVRTAGPGTVGRFALGADLINAKNLSFSLLYSPEVGSGYSSQGGTARISYRF